LTGPAKSNSGFFRAVLGLMRPFWLSILLATAAGAFAGLATMGLLATINHSLHASGEFGGGAFAAFAALCVLSIGGGALSGIANTQVGQKIVTRLRKDVSDRVLRAPIPVIERHGSHRLLAVLTSDIDAVSTFTLQFPAFMIALTTAVGSFGYLLALSRPAFALCTAAAALGLLAGRMGQLGWVRDYESARDTEDALRHHYRAITDGAKELRLSRPRRQRVHGFLVSGAVERIAQLRASAMRRLWIVDAVIASLFFGVIGILLAARESLGVGAEAMTGTVLVLLFAKGPIEQLIMVLPQLGQAQTSFRRIAAISAGLDQQVPLPAGGEALPWSELELRAARYDFAGADAPFALGPLDLRVRRGETVFIVGENGSGKTTLIKLLLGLYAPSGGALLLDGKPVAAEAIDDYRQMFSCVFSDYFLFEDLPPGGGGAADALARFAIAHKVKVEGGAFATAGLSSGERKRLALVHALIEDRPIMVFDEWAADQDPSFRRVFYTELLPELKRRAKTLIVISHDDRYFGAADRLVRLTQGRIETAVPA
jgi:putative pyoverdin transport system ATP-binding/permease protein